MKPTPLSMRNPSRARIKKTFEAPRETVIPLTTELVPLKMVTEAERKAKAEAEKVILRQVKETALGTVPGLNPTKPQKYNPKKIATIEYDGEVPRLYEGRNAVVMATGPSLTTEVIEMIRPYHEDGTVVTFGCNDVYRICDYLDVHYACDPPWWDVHVWQGSIADHPAVKWTQDKNIPRKYGINWIPGTSANGMSSNQKLIHFGGNSGYQTLNLAFLYGCSRIALVGYNMGIPPGKQQHFFGSHPAPLSRSTSFGSFANAYNTIQPNLKARVANCTPETNLNAFQQRPLKEVLDEWRSPDVSKDDPPQ